MTTHARRTEAKSLDQIAREWDALAERRHQQISQGVDLSFRHTLAPLTAELLSECDNSLVLDVGCGTGELTYEIAREADHVVAFDLSRRSLAIAEKHVRGQPVEFIHGSLHELVSELANRQFRTVVAAMTLMTAPDLRSVAQDLARVLAGEGCLVATLTHPWFWPRYWGYDQEPWFDYHAEFFIEAPFQITNDKTDLVTTHVHRPLEVYIKTFSDHGFALEELREPTPVQASELSLIHI